MNFVEPPAKDDVVKAFVLVRDRLAEGRCDTWRLRFALLAGLGLAPPTAARDRRMRRAGVDVLDARRGCANVGELGSERAMRRRW